MLTGKVPFEATTDYELMQAHINSPPEWPSRRVPGIAPHAEKALMKALSKKAHDRFPTLTAFKEALGAPASRTEALSIVHKVTRLAGSAGISPAITSAMSSVTETVKKSSVPFAVKGIVAGGGLALVLAAGLLYLLSPHSTAQSGLPVTKVSNDGAPVQVIPQPQNNPYFVEQRRPTTTAPAQPSDTRQGQPPGNASSKPGSGGRGPFEVAAEPQNPGPAAGNQPTGPSASNTTPQERVTPAANSAPAQNSGSAAPAASASTPGTAPDAAGANSGSASGSTPAASDTAAQKVAAADASDSASKPARADGRKVSDKEVVAAYAAKNYASARELAEPCAKDGNADCQFILGRILETGSAGPKDPGAAADWYRKAADAGLAKARNNLGGLYYRGEGVPKDSRVAAEWFSKAAYQNYADAQFSLASLYETGDGVPKSISEAKRWYAEVAKSADKELAADAQEALDRLNGRRKR